MRSCIEWQGERRVREQHYSMPADHFATATACVAREISRRESDYAKALPENNMRLPLNKGRF